MQTTSNAVKWSLRNVVQNINDINDCLSLKVDTKMKLINITTHSNTYTQFSEMQLDNNIINLG